MSLVTIPLGLAAAQGAGAAARSSARRMATPQEQECAAPAWKQVITWLLFWPLLTLIAGQAVYFSGPARDAAAYQNGATRGSHYFLYVYLLMLLGFVVTGWRSIVPVLRANLLIPASLLLAFVSVSWSEAQLISFQMCIQVTLCTLFACYLSARMSTERLMSLLIFMGTIAGLLSVVFVVALPSYGVFAGYAGGAWQGICNQKNTLGLSMAFLLTPIFFTRQHRRWQKVLYAMLMLFLIAMSQSRGAWLYTAGMLAFVGWLFVLRRLRWKEAFLLVSLTAIVAAAAVYLGVTQLSAMARLLGKDPSMSGRSLIYIEVWHSICKRPILGYGFDSFWGPAVKNIEAIRIGTVIGWPNIGYAENGLLELGLQLGLLGVSFVVAMIARAYTQGARLLGSSAYAPRVGWFLSVLVLESLTNIDAGRFMSSDFLEWPLVLICCIGINKEMRQVRERARVPVSSQTVSLGPAEWSR